MGIGAFQRATAATVDERRSLDPSAAKELLFYSKSGKESGTPPWGIPDGVYPCEEVA
jgi:hypothetical protein